MATKLYFHDATSGLSNLPTTEQSTLTVTTNHNVDALTVNRTMDPVKGITQINKTWSSLSSGAQNNYWTRFVSPTIDTTTTGTTISANTWDYCLGAQTESGEFWPCQGASGTTYVNCYVWDTSNSTKVGTILDGNSNADFSEPSAGLQTWVKGTFAGSAVSSVTNTCVIVMEIWYRPTTTTFADTLHFFYDGVNDTAADNAQVANNASFINTPQDITFNQQTTLYLRAASNSLAGTLPTAEQSTLTSNKDADAQTVNRSLDTTKGSAQTSISLTTNTVSTLQNYYYTKFVSWQYLNQTSIAAQNWGYSFAANEPNAAANFPCSGALQPVYVNLYVWKTSNGTKTGTILDGNTASAYTEPSTAATEKAEWGTFAGSAVTGITPGDDVLVFEVWFKITQGNTTARIDIFYFDGATDTRATDTTVSAHASLLLTMQSIAFTPTQAGGGVTIPTTVYVEWEEA